MRDINLKVLPALSLLVGLGGCSTTARYVTAEHWSSGNQFYVGFTEYKETNLVLVKTGESSAHLLLCNASADNSVECRPQVAVDRLLNPDASYPDPPPAPATQPAPAPEPVAGEPEGTPNA